MAVTATIEDDKGLKITISPLSPVAQTSYRIQVTDRLGAVESLVHCRSVDEVVEILLDQYTMYCEE